MPIPAQTIGATNPKNETFQYSAKRIAGLPLKIGPTGPASVTNRRIVSIQQDADGTLFAVISPTALASHTIVGWGVLETALQEGGLTSIAPDPNNLVEGDLVVVLREPTDVYMIDIDESNSPTEGIGAAYLDHSGRLSSVSSGSNLALAGAVFSGVPGFQLSGQLKDGCMFYQLNTPLDP